MRRGILIYGLVIFLSVISWSASAGDTRKNTILNLESYKGKVVLLDFWASWCGPCLSSFPWMNAMHRKYQKQGLVVVAVNLDSERALAEKFLKKNPAFFQIVYDPDGTTAAFYKIPAMPTSFLIDSVGEMRFKHFGFEEKDSAKYEAEIRSLLREAKK